MEGEDPADSCQPSVESRESLLILCRESAGNIGEFPVSSLC